MLSPQQALGACGLQGLDDLPQLRLGGRIVDVVAHAQGIEHRGDAGGHDLRIVGHHRRHGRPAHLRPGLQMPLQVIGMQLDQPGREQVAAEVDPPLGGAAAADLDDALAGNGDPTVDHRIGQHHPGILDDNALPHGAPAHAHAANLETSMTRSATRDLTSSSWKMPSSAAPARLRASMKATTASRLAASSEAVGSTATTAGTPGGCWYATRGWSQGSDPQGLTPRRRGAWRRASKELDERDLPSVATIERHTVEILGGGSG